MTKDKAKLRVYNIKHGALYRARHKDRAREKSWREQGITFTYQEYQELLIKQDFKCAVCRTHVSTLKRALAVDHDHLTGRVRGLLCRTCNVGLGHFNDDRECVKNLVEYLERYQ